MPLSPMVIASIKSPDSASSTKKLLTEAKLEKMNYSNTFDRRKFRHNCSNHFFPSNLSIIFLKKFEQ